MEGAAMSRMSPEAINRGICCYSCATEEQRWSHFIVCLTCGNKRCPKSTDHALDCTNSNEPGQAGSRYAKVPS
jgi:hypothetical protein